MRWILVADSARCRIFAQEMEFGPISEIEDLLHPANRLREREHFSDRQGRTFDSGGAGRHAMERSRDARAEEADRFAQTIHERLDKARTANEVDGIVLIVEPRFLGRLRDKLSGPLQKIIELEIPANLTRADVATIRARFTESLQR